MPSKPSSKSQASEALRKLRKEEQRLQARLEALAGLMDVSIIINSTLDLDEVMRLVMEKAQMVMKAEASSVMIINEEKQVLEVPVALGEVGEKVQKIELPIGQGIAGWVAAHGEPQLIADVRQDARFNPAVDRETGFQTRSILAVPLQVRGKLIGVAEVINRRDGQPFDHEDLELFLTFCRQVSLAIQNARVHRLELEKQRIEQQLQTAQFIQQSFLPEDLPSSPERQFEIAARSLPATAVGGDLYDFANLGPAALGVSIGDVSGKGIPAALYMARFVSDFRLLSQTQRHPAQLFAEMNRLLCKRSRRGIFVTSIYGILNPQTGEFEFANAGHLPCLHVHSKSRQVEVVEGAAGIPLGILPDHDFGTARITVDPGDFLVFITDGVVESKNSDGREYSLERVVEVLGDLRPSAQEMLDALLQDVQRFSKGTSQHDDLTILVVKWR